MNAIAILATILLVVSAIKILVILIKPKAWGKVVKVVYGKPMLTMILSLILAVIVLNYLLAEVTIVQIFAVMVFVALLAAMSLSVYAKEIIPTAVKMLNEKNFMRKAWLPIIVWVILLIWLFISLFL